jgi:hypothetical protein
VSIKAAQTLLTPSVRRRVLDEFISVHECINATVMWTASSTGDEFRVVKPPKRTVTIECRHSSKEVARVECLACLAVLHARRFLMTLVRMQISLSHAEGIAQALKSVLNLS